MIASNGKPFVLHVDDEPDDLRLWSEEVRAQDRINLQVLHPQEVDEASLRRAALVLVDFKIDHWPERAKSSALALKPTNGLAVLASLQETAFELDATRARAFALYTAVIQDVARELVHQPHIVARAHNLEWVFEKNKEGSARERAARVAELADSVAALPKHWPGGVPSAANAALHEWLGLSSSVPWSDAATRSVRGCRPPIHEFAEHTLGVGVVRWILHKIIPYPTFLLDDAHLAARLRVSFQSLREAADSEEFCRLFGEVQYQGQLATFAGRRWWRAGVEHALFEIAADSPGDVRTLHKELRERVSGLEYQSASRLFAVIGSQFKTKDVLATEDSVVEVRPDDWPPFADEAWALRGDLEDAPELKAVAVDEEGA